MYCPEHLVFGKGGLWVWLYWRDVPRHMIPAKVWLNPLRYEVSFVLRGRRLFTWNREGMMWGHISWKLWKRRQWEKKQGKQP